MLEKEFEKITDKSSLNEIQEYLSKMVVERGFDKETLKDEMILLTEEIGELAKEVRKISGDVKLDVEKKELDDNNIRGELSDVFEVLVCVCNILGVSLYECFKEKEKKNFKRE